MAEEQQTYGEKIRVWEEIEALRKLPRYDEKEPFDFAGDKASWGRYLLCFFLAGFFGLLAIHWARYYGWRGVWISLGIFVALLFLLTA